MTVKELFTKLNALVWYAHTMAKNNKGKIETFINRLKLDIAKDVLTKDNPPRSYSKVLSKVLRSKVMRWKIIRERRQPRSITLALRYYKAISWGNWEEVMII